MAASRPEDHHRKDGSRRTGKSSTRVRPGRRQRARSTVALTLWTSEQDEPVARTAEPDARQVVCRGLRPDVQNVGGLSLHLSDDGTSGPTTNAVSSAECSGVVMHVAARQRPRRHVPRRVPGDLHRQHMAGTPAPARRTGHGRRRRPRGTGTGLPRRERGCGRGALGLGLRSARGAGRHRAGRRPDRASRAGSDGRPRRGGPALRPVDRLARSADPLRPGTCPAVAYGYPPTAEQPARTDQLRGAPIEAPAAGGLP